MVAAVAQATTNHDVYCTWQGVSSGIRKCGITGRILSNSMTHSRTICHRQHLPQNSVMLGQNNAKALKTDTSNKAFKSVLKLVFELQQCLFSSEMSWRATPQRWSTMHIFGVPVIACQASLFCCDWSTNLLSLVCWHVKLSTPFVMIQLQCEL